MFCDFDCTAAATFPISSSRSRGLNRGAFVFSTMRVMALSSIPGRSAFRPVSCSASSSGLLPRSFAIPLMACLMTCWFICVGFVVEAGDTMSSRLFRFYRLMLRFLPRSVACRQGPFSSPLKGAFFVISPEISDRDPQSNPLQEFRWVQDRMSLKTLRSGECFYRR